MKEQIKTPEKRTKQNGNKQSIRCRVQNSDYKIFKELNEDLNSTEKIQSETKDKLFGINNLQGNDRRVGEAENQVNDLEQRKQKTTRKMKRKKNP